MRREGEMWESKGQLSALLFSFSVGAWRSGTEACPVGSGDGITRQLDKVQVQIDRKSVV